MTKRRLTDDEKRAVVEIYRTMERSSLRGSLRRAAKRWYAQTGQRVSHDSVGRWAREFSENKKAARWSG